MKAWRATVMWTTVVLAMFGPYIAGLQVLKRLAPSWFQYGDRRAVMIVSYAIAIPMWWLLYKVLTKWRWVNRED